MKLFHKTFLYLSLLFGAIIGIVHLSIYFFLPSFYINTINQQLEDQIELLGATIQEMDAAMVPNVLSAYAQRNNLSVLADIEGQKQSFGNSHIQLQTFLEDNPNITISNEEIPESVLIQQKEFQSRDQKKVQLQIAESTRPVSDARKVTLSLLPVTTLLSLLLSFLFSYFYSRKVTKPILEMVTMTKRMEQLQEDAYFHIRGQDEIGILAAQINQVYGQLWKTIRSLEKENIRIIEIEKQKTDFFRCASHELKTPLAALRILLENMQYNIGKYKDHDTYLLKGIQQIDELTDRVKDILNISKIHERNTLDQKSLISVKEEIQQILGDYEILAKAKKLQMSLEIDLPLQVEMNRDMLNTVLTNIIGNAIVYSHNGGEMVIQNIQTKLIIKNTCEPLTDQHLTHIFEAFYRPDFARNSNDGGSGLGLYIVKEILEAWSIPYSFESCDIGMCFSLDFTSVLK